ncbi:peptidoglycan-recognition protein LE [Malaya genurostris]|uniref:peptidoglycan-recognition protein LE n=1 Tax=Malaya genurostris TaxID=325434 RepID=UPI0026F38572|nr:peptidoglycan-recognition protein LE [Malaya genurostris]
MNSKNKLVFDAAESSTEEKCSKWLENSDYSAISDDILSSDGHSTEFSSSTTDSESSNTDDMHSIASGNEIKMIPTKANITDINHADILQAVFMGNSNQTFGNIQVENSNKVHIGNVTYVTGPIHIVQARGSDLGSAQTFETSPLSAQTQPYSNESKRSEKLPQEKVDQEERNNDKLFVTNISRHIDSRVLRIVDRRTWLAQPALEYEKLDTPVPFVVISHTATETAETQADMVYMVRNIQCFHIESRRWNDIAYNFLVGNDGNVYEGRGWQRIGAHTYGYNSLGIGISFVGCFMNELPATIALDACKRLMERGVRDGHIRKDYQLLAHCQCSPTESPGRMLFEEIKTWPHWVAQPWHSL